MILAVTRPRAVAVPQQYVSRRVFLPAAFALSGLAAAGLGSASTANTINMIASTGAQTTVGILVAIGTLGGPVGAAVAGLISVASLIASSFHGCGQTCVAATQVVNQIEPYLRDNVNHYLSSPVHYASLQAAALNNFDTAWAAVLQACGDPGLQEAGQRCITDRQQGACKYKNGNDCWNWFIGYRDPIANDPNVVPDPSPVSSAVDSIASAFGGGDSKTGELALIAGLVLAGALL